MDPEDILVTLLLEDPDVVALIGERIYPDIMPPTVVYPFVVYQQTGSDLPHSLEGLAGVQLARFQVDIWALDHETAKCVSAAVKTALSRGLSTLGEPAFAVLVQGAQLTFDEGALVYHGILPVSVEHQEAA